MSLDGHGKEWRKIPPLPAPFSKKKKSFVKAAWNKDGLHFFARIPDTTIEPTLNGQTFRDYIQIWIEKNAARGYYLHENAGEYFCAPAIEGDKREGKGHSRHVYIDGADEPSSAYSCFSRNLGNSYTVEMTLPAAEMEPAVMAPGTRIGMNFAISDGRKAIQQFWTDKYENSAWATPRRKL